MLRRGYYTISVDANALAALYRDGTATARAVVLRVLAHSDGAFNG